MSYNKVSNLKPLLVIDIGTDKIKYSQSNLNTFAVSNILRNKIQEKQQNNIISESEILNSILKKTDQVGIIKETTGKVGVVNKFMSKLKDAQATTGHSNNHGIQLNYDDNSPIHDENYKKSKENDDFLLYKDSQGQEENVYHINPNTIFDTNFFVDAFPSILTKIKSVNDKESLSQLCDKFNFYNVETIINLLDLKENQGFDLQYSWEFSGDRSNFNLESTRWEFEPFHSGIIYDFDAWRRSIDLIGQNINQNFYSSLLSDTPVCFTQNCLRFEHLQKQSKQKYEILFEEYKSPFVLICSQGLLNLFSQNNKTGVVVDIGDSGTSITNIVNGFTQYDNSIYLPFFSGRNISSLLALSRKNSQDKPDVEDISNQYSLSYTDYLKSKFIKESSFFQCHLPGKPIQTSQMSIFNNQITQNFFEASTFPYLLFYPEIYKTILYKPNFLSLLKGQKVRGKPSKDIEMLYIKNDFKYMFDFIYNENKLGAFSERVKFSHFNSPSFYDMFILPYNESESSEKDTLLNTRFVKSSAVKNFRFLSLSHILVSHIGNLMKNDSFNAKNYSNIFITGGVLNTPFLKDILKEDILSMNGIKGLTVHFPESDPSTSFYKGVNYLSKLPDLETIMVSRQNYFDYGAEHLSYNYI